MKRTFWTRLALSIAFLITSATASSALSPRLAEPQPDAAALKDGLAVQYYFNKFDHVGQIERWMKYKEGKPGDPLSMLNYRVGRGPVLTSGVANLVGAHITGYIAFDKPGDYQFEVTSNDGVRILLGGMRLYEDPKPHPDRTSDPITVTIEQTGWYPLVVFYFEKKNTSTLELRWSPPGASGFDFVPASVLKH